MAAPATRRRFAIIDACLLAAAIAIPLGARALPGDWNVTGLFTNVIVFAILGLALNVLTGFTGLLNLGVAAFAAIGAYTFSIATCDIYPFQVGFWWGLGATLVAGAIAGFALGAPTLRVRGDYLAIVTMGFGEIVKDVLINLDTITKGTQGINPLPGPSLFGHELETNGRYYLLLAILVVVVAGCRALERSRVGRAWLSIREDELASRAMGIPPDRTKMLAFATCAALAALSGGLGASLLSSSGEPGNFDFQISILALCIVIVGGMGSVRGVLLGAVIMVGINPLVLEQLSRAIGSSSAPAPGALEAAQGLDRVGVFLKVWAQNVLINPNNWKFGIFGLALILMMIFRPEGLLPPRGLHEEAPDEGADGADGAGSAGGAAAKGARA
ncbi:MAG: branched-chain amino acid ABC transporter permease [Phycisphaerales bacterium]